MPEPRPEVARLGRGRLENLRQRAMALRAVRGFFDDRGFLEVDTPLLVPAPGTDIHIEAVAAVGERWLITSPEFQMKRLLAGGLPRIYTMCKCFRAREKGAHHQVEFSMLEWYRAQATLDQILDDTRALLATVAEAAVGDTRVASAGGHGVVDLAGPWARMNVAEAMERFAGVVVTGAEDAHELAARVRAAGIDIGTATAWDDVFYSAFVTAVEPAIARLTTPVVIDDWPAPLAALARRKPKNPALVERFEVYVGGLELANAYGELTDPVEQRARFERDLAIRRERGLPAYPIDERFLAALEQGLPPCAGIALGLDRLVMLITGATHIRQVLAFATDEL